MQTYATIGAFETAINSGDWHFVAGIGAVGITTLYCLVQNVSTGGYEIARVTL